MSVSGGSSASHGGDHGEVEYLSAHDVPGGRPMPRRRRAAAVAGGAALTLLTGAAVYGVLQFLESGESPATVVPADAVGYLAVDLDPGGEQKLAAWETMRRFPSLSEELGSGNDPRTWLVDLVNADSTDKCRLDFDKDVAGWLGHKAAFAGVERGGAVEPFVVLEVSDAAAARSSVTELAGCGEWGMDVGTAVSGSYLVVAADDDVAADIAEDGRRSPLADDATFQARTRDAGDQGIVTGYLAPRAIELMIEETAVMEEEFSSAVEAVPEDEVLLRLEGDSQGVEVYRPSKAERREMRRLEREMFSPEAFEDAPGPQPSKAQLRRWRQDFRAESGSFSGPPMARGEELSEEELAELEDMGEMEGAMLGGPEMLFMMASMSSMGGLSPLGLGPLGVLGAGPDLMRERLADFDGAALQVRFADGGVEAQVAASGVDQGDVREGGVRFSTLPESTALSFASATGPAAFEQVEAALSMWVPEAQWRRQVAEFERSTGLSYPEDMETLLGENLTVAVDASLDPAAFETIFMGVMAGRQSPPMPLGVVISTDEPQAVADIAGTLVESFPGGAPQVHVVQGEGAVAVGFDRAHVDRLAAGGALGGTDGFEQTMPYGDDVGSGLYVDFDEGGWFERATSDKGSPDPDLAPLSSLGMSQRVEGDDVDLLLRLTTD